MMLLLSFGIPPLEACQSRPDDGCYVAGCHELAADREGTREETDEGYADQQKESLSVAVSGGRLSHDAHGWQAAIGGEPTASRV
jgi:hypothetical protein